MSATTRRKGRAKYDKDDLLDPPAKIVRAARRSHNATRRRWAIPITVLAFVIVFFYYGSIKDIFRKPKSWPRNDTAPLRPDPSRPVREHPGESDAFIVADIPGRGKGMVAIRDIEQGERIITEKAAFVAPSQISESPSALVAQLLREASPKDREAVLNLSYVHFPKDLDPETHPDEVALAIFQTIAVAAGDGVGIFPQMARLNHGCSSAFNAIYTWRDKEQVLVVHALKRILKGQVWINFDIAHDPLSRELITGDPHNIHGYKETKSRAKLNVVGNLRSYLEQNYGFTCMCSVCSLSDTESRASDERLTAISEGYAKFATWGQGAISGVDAIETVRMIWSTEDEEGYWSERGQLAADAAWVAAAHSDASATSEWAELATVWYGYELGGDSEQAREMAGIMSTPRSHYAWGSREPQTIGGPIG
ncbi:hypothetical protein DXG01_007114 [Tephrocybe rancida]|nr:hypothetical protein DXG01_007114 [Tephrocybe rancida]